MSVKELMTGRPSELYDTKVREVLVDVENGEGLIIGLRVDINALHRGMGLGDANPISSAHPLSIR
jgi:hypothetical protein